MSEQLNSLLSIDSIECVGPMTILCLSGSMFRSDVILSGSVSGF
jgi:hypothetical protein